MAAGQGNDEEEEVIMAGRFPASIHMVPASLRNLSPISFTPRGICIGPFHRELGDKNLQEKTKELKTISLHQLLSRLDAPKDQVLESCTRKVRASLKQIKASYVWTKTYDDEEITDMMVTDAFFIIEFLLCVPSLGMLGLDVIMHDLVLLENQIPLFVLDDIFQLTVPTFNPSVSLAELLLPVLSCNALFIQQAIAIDKLFCQQAIDIDKLSIKDAPHILGLVHRFYMPPVYDIESRSPSSRTYSIVDHLDKAWVTFKPHEHQPAWVMGMELESQSSMFSCLIGPWNKPTLRMPVLYVADYTELVLRNLIACEQPCDHVASYVYAMRMLADTEEDVARLACVGVLINSMRLSEKVSDMIKSINVIAGEDEDSLDLKKSNTHSNGSMSTTYFSRAWNAIASNCGVDHPYWYVRQHEHLD